MKTTWRIKKETVGIDCPTLEVVVKLSDIEHDIVCKNIKNTRVVFEEPMFCPGVQGGCRALPLTAYSSTETYELKCQAVRDIYVTEDCDKKTLQASARIKFKQDRNYEEIAENVAKTLHDLVEATLNRLLEFEKFEHKGTIEMSQDLKKKVAVLTFVENSK